MNVGIDIEEVARFKSLVRNPRFLARVFTAAEVAYCRSRKNKLQHFAVRFAAKEAIWKALSAIMARKKWNLAHRDIGVKNDAAGKPHVSLPARFGRLSKKISLSLSHTQSTVVAVAFFEG